MRSVYLSPRKKKAKSIVVRFASKGLFVSLAVLLQVAFYFAFWIYIDSQYYIFSYVATGLGAMAVLKLTDKDIHPSIKQGWMFLILLFPLSGSILYFTLGKSRGAFLLRKKIKKNFASYDELKINSKGVIEVLESKQASYLPLVRYLNSQKFPVYDNTQVKYFGDGRELFESVLHDIASAKTRIFLEFFIVDQGDLWNQIIDLLSTKAKEGVLIYLIYDGFGGGINLPKEMPSLLEENQIHVSVYNPMFPIFSGVQNNRDHRKIVVIDDQIAYTGGVNIADEYINFVERFGYWKDSGVRIQGEGALGFSYMFLEMWNAISKHKLSPCKLSDHSSKNTCHQYLIPYTDSPLDNEALSQNVIESMFSLARDKIYISTPYLVPPYEMKELLFKAVKSNIDVCIFIPGIPDKKLIYLITMAYARTFVEAGIKVYLYKPGFLHAKNILIDDKIASVGSVNIDFRSLYHHFECGLILLECDELSAIKKDFEDMMKESKQLFVEDFQSVNIFRKILEVIMKLFLPLL